MNNSVFCRQQASKERANALAASLAHVRERSERAAATWEAMADRAERTEALRAGRN